MRASTRRTWKAAGFGWCAFGLAAFLTPAPAAGQAAPAGPLFQTSDRCVACHNGLTTPSGEDYSIGFDWRPSMMANAGRDPYWQAGVRRETIDHPDAKAAIEDECSICHMPMATVGARAAGHEGQIFAHLPFDLEKDDDRLAADGVSCSLCHQITPERFGTRESFVGGFVIDTTIPLSRQRLEYGPFAVSAGHARVMRTSSGGLQPAQSEHVRRSELCATCHTLYTNTLGPGGKPGTEFPEQMPYREWLHSGYRDTQSCQSCHMPAVPVAAPISPVFGEPREGVRRHVFVGGNFFMARLLNRYRGELGVDALPQEQEAAAARNIEFLQAQTAKVSISSAAVGPGRLEAVISVQNLGGHKFPTAYPSRRAWLHVTVRDRNGRVLFESGAFEPSGLIRGNDNDADAAKFEPHYREITTAGQVQIYEAIMVDSTDRVTTGLLHAAKYVKDNRLLPRGFKKETAEQDVAVQGDAARDPDFSDSGDSVQYTVDVGNTEGPFAVEAELWYQLVSYRWAENLRAFDAFETKRFVGYYEAAAPASAIVIARAAAQK